MSIMLTPIFQILIPPANTSSFQFTPLLQTSIGAFAAILGGIVASLLSGHYLIMKVREEKRLEMLVDVLDNVYAPFQEIAEEIIKQKQINKSHNDALLKIIRNNLKYIFRCPEDIKKEISNLRENLRCGDHDEALKSVKTINGKIDELIAKSL